MTNINPEVAINALMDSLARLQKAKSVEDLSADPTFNLLELVDSFGFAELILDLEKSLDVELPLDQVDLASIVHADRLISFICEHG